MSSSPTLPSTPPSSPVMQPIVIPSQLVGEMDELKTDLTQAFKTPEAFAAGLPHLIVLLYNSYSAVNAISSSDKLTIVSSAINSIILTLPITPDEQLILKGVATSLIPAIASLAPQAEMIVQEIETETVNCFSWLWTKIKSCFTRSVPVPPVPVVTSPSLTAALVSSSIKA